MEIINFIKHSCLTTLQLNQMGDTYTCKQRVDSLQKNLFTARPVQPVIHKMIKGANSGNRVAVNIIAIVLTEKKMIEAEKWSGEMNQRYFNLDETLVKLINRSKLKKKKRFGTSQLDKWKYELIALREKGATLEQLQDYLQQKGIRVVLSTISRWLNHHGTICK
jgi:hypothetical protein